MNNAALEQEARDEAAKLIRKICARKNGESVKLCVARAAKALGWPYGRTEDIYWKEARVIHAWELDALRREAAKHSEK